MSDQKIKCPKCGHEFEIGDSITADIRKNLEKELKAESEKKEKEIADLKKNLTEIEKTKTEEFEKELQKQKQELWKVAQEKAKEKQNVELKDLQSQIKEKEEALEKAQEHELELRKKQRELKTKEKEMKIEMEREMDKQREKLEEAAKKQALEEQRLKIAEKDKQMDMMRKQIEDLKRKSEQGSMQIQGEVQEEDLKDLLNQTFVADEIKDVPTGINGADLIQTVRDNFGRKSGIILWESKNTKSFSNGWLKKLKDDQAATKADVCVLVTQAMPDDIDNFGFVDGVWVTNYQNIIALTTALRQNIMQIAQLKSSIEGKDEKMEILYNYLSGPQFKNRVENIVSAFTGMKDELEKEKRAMQRIWSRREKEIDRVVMNTSGLYGDMQGIIGTSLGRVDALELEGEDLDEIGLGI